MNFIEITCSPGPKVDPVGTPEPLFVLAGGALSAFGMPLKSPSLQRRVATSVETAVEISVEAPQVTPEVAPDITPEVGGPFTGQVTVQLTGQACLRAIPSKE